MTLDWQVLLIALVAISLQLAVLATSLQPKSNPPKSTGERTVLKKKRRAASLQRPDRFRCSQLSARFVGRSCINGGQTRMWLEGRR